MSFEINIGSHLSEVSSSKLYTDKTQKHLDENGLFSERIFGPEKSFRCKCGKLNSKVFDAGKKCSQCQVICESDNLRMTTFAKISVPFGFIKPNRKKQLFKILGNKNKQLINPIMAQASLAQKRYLGFSHDFKSLKIFNDLELDKRFIKIPLRITGIYSFILALKYLAIVLRIPIAQEIFDKQIISFYVKVLPPKTRPCVKLNNKLQITDVNKAYIHLIQRNESNKPIINNLETDESNWLGMIDVLIKDGIFEEEIVDYGIMEYDTLSAVYQYSVDEIYTNIYQTLHGKKGFIRSKILGKTIEFSARSIIRANPAIKPYQISVSKKILYKLWHPYFLYYLINVRNIEGNTCYNLICNRTYEDNIPVFNQFLKWFYDDTPSELDKKLRRLSFINRQPSLFRHSCPGVEIIPADDDTDHSIGLSPLALEPLNADFDGDSMAIYVLHDKFGLQEIKEKAFFKSYVEYDSSSEMLSTIRHEALYSGFLLTSSEVSYDKKPIYINNLNELPESSELFNNLSCPVYLKNKIYSYGISLFNKWCGFNDIIIEFVIGKHNASHVSRVIYNHFNQNNDIFYNNITNLLKQLLFFISTIYETPTINLSELLSGLTEKEEKLFKKLPNNQPEVGYYVHKSLCNRCLDFIDKNKQIYKLFKSGSRFSSTQLERSILNIGFCANSQNEVVPTPVTTNLISGLTEEQFFAGGDGTRKGIADNAKSTPQSGFMERSLVMILSPLEIVEDDCQSRNGIEVVIMSEKHAKILVHKWYKDPYKDMDWEELNYNTAKLYINKKIIIRSPMTCQTPNFKMCQKCFGTRYFPTKYVGITAGQVLAERLTQLSMRTFHQSGSAELNAKPIFQKLIKDHLIDIITTDNKTILKFDTNQFPDNLEEIHGFDSFDNNTMIFNHLTQPINNNDAIAVLNKIKDLLRIQKRGILQPTEYYHKMTSLVLSVGAPYSSFIEMLFANMFVVDLSPLRFWRYHQTEPIVIKFGDRSLATKLSKLLGLLYQPNTDSIVNVDKLNSIDLSDEKLTIYEKIFLENL